MHTIDTFCLQSSLYFGTGVTSQIEEKLNRCLPGIGYLLECDEVLLDLLADDDDVPPAPEAAGPPLPKQRKGKGTDYPILALEHLMLKIATSLNCTLCRGVVYVLVLPPDGDGETCIR